MEKKHTGKDISNDTCLRAVKRNLTCSLICLVAFVIPKSIIAQQNIPVKNIQGEWLFQKADIKIFTLEGDNVIKQITVSSTDSLRRTDVLLVSQNPVRISVGASLQPSNEAGNKQATIPGMSLKGGEGLQVTYVDHVFAGGYTISENGIEVFRKDASRQDAWMPAGHYSYTIQNNLLNIEYFFFATIKNKPVKIAISSTYAKENLQ